MGSHIAKVQLKAIFKKLLTHIPDIEVGEPELLTSNFIHGIKRMPCALTPR